MRNHLKVKSHQNPNHQKTHKDSLQREEVIKFFIFFLDYFKRHYAEAAAAAATPAKPAATTTPTTATKFGEILIGAVFALMF